MDVDRIKNACSETLVLTLLGEGPMHGYEMCLEIEQRAGRPVSIGAVYATLGRLGDKGLVSFRTSDPLPVKGGRSRKYFRLTADGQDALQQSMAMLERMRQGLELDADSGRARK